ncbi:MAG TPA: 2-oxo acid dehydrogenase subunit E2 [Candidatus Marinimicrobia bacterium]|nr:2-oxo acid dehydrogenase subunit E2 [Candidatus Neomarinimicrobiota bacterium]
MVIDIIMPKMGESIVEGTIIEWRKSVGDSIEVDEILLEIGTDKVDSEIPSPNAGIITELLAEPNDVIDIGVVIARIETEGSASVKIQSKIEEEESPPPSTEVASIKPSQIESEKVISTSGEKKYYTPIVKSIARKEGVSQDELASISGSGNNNRVTKKDLLAYLEQRSSATAPAKEAPAAMEQPEVSVSAPVISPLADERIEMDKMRRSIAEHMRHSLDTSAHVHLMNEVDMTRIVNYVDENSSSFKMREGFPLTYTPFIVSACVRALQIFPDMNSSLDGTSIIRKKNVNIGLAVAVDAGLMVPVIPQCEELNFLGLCRKVRDLAIRTRNKQIRPDELSGSTFSISNFGMFNVTTGTPIINQPNVGILGVGTIKKKPVVIETKQGDTIGIRSMMFLSIGFDHRLVDGAGGAKFVETVQKNLENMDLEHLF